jgi:lysophospholipase L1-like esterase
MMRKLPINSTFYSLAVGGATVRNKFSDLTTYPYTSRPISSDNSGNKNTLGSQIEKLKRLMNGTDLDSGESKLYENPSDYPNVIIIQGGMNDGFDNDTSTYTEQFTKELNNVYIKLSSEGAPYLGSAFVKTPISEVNRTIYAGAYRYLAEELLTLFPNAQIFIVTASRLGYWMTDVNNVRNKTAEQQRISARLLGASIIDWNAEGNVNTIQNYVKGSGTTDDPYILDRTALSKDTDDAMHPNDSGGVKYGRLAFKVINERFINFQNEL